VRTFAFEILHMDGTIVLALRGELDVAERCQLERMLSPVVASYRPAQVTLDLSGLTFLDAGGLATLVRHLGTHGGGAEQATLRGVQPIVMRLLDVSGCTELFNIEVATPVLAAHASGQLSADGAEQEIIEPTGWLSPTTT
jgi:anti-anti-sigma factor